MIWREREEGCGFCNGVQILSRCWSPGEHRLKGPVWREQDLIGGIDYAGECSSGAGRDRDPPGCCLTGPVVTSSDHTWAIWRPWRWIHTMDTHDGYMNTSRMMKSTVLSWFILDCVYGIVYSISQGKGRIGKKSPIRWTLDRIRLEADRSSPQLQCGETKIRILATRVFRFSTFTT